MSPPHTSRRATALAATAVALLGFTATASAADVQANRPQVAGDATSDTTARFPTNKQNEPSIAVNPTDANHLIAGSNDEQRQPACGAPPRPDADPTDCSFFPGVGTDGVYTSSDGGTTWTNRGLLDELWGSSPFVSDGDPVIVYGPKPDGKGFSYRNGARAYYVGLGSYKDGLSPFNANKAPGFIIVSHSDDNGVHWTSPVRATTKDNPNTFNDKNSAWADDNPASPYFGRLYVGFTAFRSATLSGNGNEPIQVSRSTDGGGSFSAPQQLSPASNNSQSGGRQGSDIMSGPDGSVYVAYEEGGAQVVAISRDGGTSYAKARPIGPVTDLDDPIPGANFRTDSFPNIATDPRVGSTLVYTSWSTKRGGVGRTVLASSKDRGLTWGTPTVVSAAAPGYAFFDALDVAPTGRVDLGFQSLVAKDPTTFGTGNAAIDAYYVGAAANSDPRQPAGTPTAARRVSTASSDPAASAQNNLERQFWGDYNTLVSTASRAFLIDTDSRTGAGCPAVDAFQRPLLANGTAEPEEPEDRDAAAEEEADPAKPAPPTQCPAQYGNTDIYVSVITP